MKPVAFISGSSRGIGKAIAQELAQDHIVYINGRDEKSLNAAVDEITSKGLVAKPINLDLTQPTNIMSSLEIILKNEGRIDTVVSNLGSGKSAPGLDLGPSEIQASFDINFFSAANLALTFQKKMNSGNLIFISSIAGLEYLGAPMAYSCAKSALITLAKNLSFQLAPKKIRVNCISPGNVMFPGSTWDTKKQESPQKTLSYIEENVPLNCFIQPEEISHMVRLILATSSLTGSNLVIDGGQSRN